MLDVLIIGGGLSGLFLARELEKAGQDWCLLEARERAGGRIYSPKGRSGHGYDMGPSWVWPHQTRILGLLARLGLEAREQYITGKLAFEDGEGQIRRDIDMALMGGAMRVSGGLQAVTDALVERVPAERMKFGAVVRSVADKPEGIDVKLDGVDAPLTARKVVFALPPRLVATRIDLGDLLDEKTRTEMMRIPTWMAGHGKMLVTYDTPFWRHRGLSGEGLSHRGPLTEFHDAGQPGGPAALFGFIHPQIVAANPDREELRLAALNQLEALFGPEAAEPVDVLIKTWLDDSFTALPEDAGLHEHPKGRVPRGMAALEEKGVFFAGSEVAPEEAGLVEGALAAAEVAAIRIGIGQT